MRKNFFIPLAIVLVVTAIIGSCRKDDLIVPSETNDTGQKTTPGKILGLYVLNEGNMGSNKASVDFLDLSGLHPTIRYQRNIYVERNPKVVKELGDVGQDIQIYGSRLWMVINASNKVEVAMASNCRRIGQVQIPNGRSIAFHGRFAYVSSYTGPLKDGSQLGRVYRIDTLTLEKVDSLVVGYQPEELCVVGNHLYVANSGGYRNPLYDRTVSEIDLNEFREIRKIDVDINLHRCQVDRHGQVWVSSRGNYADQPARLHWLDKDGSGHLQLAGSLPALVSGMCIVGDSLYYYGAQWNNATGSYTFSSGIINVQTHRIVAHTLSSSPEFSAITMPYGIIVNPLRRDFYLMDAKDFISSGELLHFHADGTFDYKVSTGDIPGHAVFLYKP